MSLPKVILTGFDPFKAQSINASWVAVQAFRGKRIAGHRVVVAELPTVFGQATSRLRDLLIEHRPVLVIGVGESSARDCLALERVAINIIDARIPDNNGVQPINESVIKEAPVGYFGTLPIKKILTNLNSVGIAAEISETAGTFVCNALFYGLMHELSTSRKFRHTRGGFIHVPAMPQQGSSPMRPEQVIEGLRVAISTSLKC